MENNCELCDKLKQQAQVHASESRTMQSIIQEIYFAAGIQKGNWNGARPVIEKLEELTWIPVEFCVPNYNKLGAHTGKTIHIKLDNGKELDADYIGWQGFAYHNTNDVLKNVTHWKLPKA